MGGQRSTRGFSVSGHDIHNAVGKSGLGHDLREIQGRQGSLLRRLENHRGSRRQRRTQLPGGHEQRKVPRDDLTGDSDRFPQRVGQELAARHVGNGQADGVAFELRRPAGHVPKQIRGQRDVCGPSDRDRLAVVQRLEFRELLAMLGNEIADPPHNLAPRGRSHATPRPLERSSGRSHRKIDVRDVAFGDGGENLAGGRVQRLERLVGFGIDPSSVDEQLPLRVNEILDALAEGDDAHDVNRIHPREAGCSDALPRSGATPTRSSRQIRIRTRHHGTVPAALTPTIHPEAARNSAPVCFLSFARRGRSVRSADEPSFDHSSARDRPVATVARDQR